MNDVCLTCVLPTCDESSPGCKFRFPNSKPQMTAEDVVEMYRAGQGLREIAEAAGRSVFWVRARLKGVEMRPKGHQPRLTEDDVKNIRELYAKGEKSRDLAERFGITQIYAIRVAKGRINFTKAQDIVGEGINLG